MDNRQAIDKQTDATARALYLASFGCVLALGISLWAVYGGQVFTDLIDSTLAWCF